MNAHRTLPALLVAIAVFVAACSSSASAPPTTPPSGPPITPPSGPPSSAADSTGMVTQTSDGGQVTVVADWAGPASGAVFDVKLDTHSVDLDAIGLADAILRNDRGETLKARPWAAPKGGHHREGTLTFDGDATAFLAGAKWIEMVITGVGDLPERTLRWEIGS